MDLSPPAIVSTLRQPGAAMLPGRAAVRPEWPGNRMGPGTITTARPDDAAKTARIALQFETLIAETLLRSVRDANLGDANLGDAGVGVGGDNIKAMIDHARAEAIARAAPIGIARLLAREAAREAAPQAATPAR